MNIKISTDTPAQKLGYGVISADKRGKILGTVKFKKDIINRKGGEMTNAEYAEQHGISKRQASKQRRNR